jgi:hypothetical protein
MEDRRTMNVEAPGDSEMRLTLTNEALPSLPLYVSRVRGLKDQAELDAMFAAVELELRNQK